MDTKLTTSLRHYNCWRCSKTFEDAWATVGGQCPTPHAPDDCCHFGESEVVREDYDFAGAHVSNVTGGPPRDA